MKIYLYLSSKIITFSVPQKVSGSFSFDENLEEESKLINIEARDSNWYIYSTTDVGVVVDGVLKDSAQLIKDTYFVLKRSGIEYLIFVTGSFEDSFLLYKYNNEMNLKIGNDPSCNINYSCPYFNGVASRVSIKEGSIALEIANNFIYLNNNILLPNKEPYSIEIGDQLNLFGLKIIFFNGFLMINNPKNLVKCDISTSKLTPFQLPYGDIPKDIEIKDVELYSKEQYFSKAPRIKRSIISKEIKLSPPPKKEGEDKMPLILTIGPMLTMGAVSGVMLVNTITRIASKATTIEQSWPTLASTGAMLISMLLWPTLTKAFNKKLRKMKKKEIIEKYTKYLNNKREELTIEQNLQKQILIENLISVSECINIINTDKINLWDKRIEQNDFLLVRVGHGNELLDAVINYPEEGFSIDEDELKKSADLMVEEFKYIQDVPIGYSLYTSKLTALMGDINKCYGMISNIILQLITFYSYEDIKIVIFTNQQNQEKWKYLKYLNHCFSNDRKIRFFSADVENAKNLGDYLNLELQSRIQLSQDGPRLFKPYYLIFTDDYSQIKGLNFTKIITETDANLGFSLLMLEKKMSKLPSKCSNFINLGATSSGILKNSFEAQKIVNFVDEIDYNINFEQITRKLSNIPIEFEEGVNQLPESATFLEMEKIGKVEQLNIMNRWDSNDSTTSLKAEVGVDENENLIYLDLHEKYHGPHGLIAGMTGSGKSEFIITYILSMAINYSPNDVSFILIDYKGGGLAFAFENKVTGVSLPHVAGIITNLDKAELDRTLVSIDSEIKRRQQIFNEARDSLGESTIDIYKYQRFFKEGKLKEPISHLFIICDEFAELKSQQPDFMDNLISVARIGRALGVHLILATQKPSGVVNDQIWSNTKFRVCLKVQDESDSKEMLKRPEAASLKQVGRFYLQVGYNEYFVLGQSAWCGAKYYPSEKIIKQVDKSVNFINDSGNIIKSIQSSNNKKAEVQGEQLSAILNNIIEVSKTSNIKAKKLWLNDIDPIILVDNLEKKYDISHNQNDIKAIIGEYDAPEKQEQGLLEYSINKDGNTIIYGNDEIEREKILNTIIYSICKNHSAKEINIYAVDYGSEQLRVFSKLPQIGGVVYMGDDEGYKNSLKLISKEIKSRKKMFNPFGGTINSYNSKNENKLPHILFILNNYEGLLEVYSNIGEDIASISRDCERYGIVFMIVCSSPSTLGRRVTQGFNNKYALHLTDISDYYTVFSMKSKIKPRNILGRGLVYNGDVHEFQTASIVDESVNLNDYIDDFAEKIRQISPFFAKPIPTLPERITLNIIEKDISTMKKVPIGISKDTLQIINYDFTAYASTTISSNKLTNINSFMDSLLEVFLRIKDLSIFFFDITKILPTASQKQYNNKKINYFDSNFDLALDKLIEIEKNPENSKFNIIYIFYGLEKLKIKADVTKIEELVNLIKTKENSKMIFCDKTSSLKSMDLDVWYSRVKNNSDGVWIGKGFGEQQNFRITKITKEMSVNYKNNYGFCVKENNSALMKVLQFNDIVEEENELNEE